MRRGLFAIVLVAAAFAGGAAVNGPGLQWVRTLILSQTAPDEEESDPGDLIEPTVSSEPGVESDPPADEPGPKVAAADPRPPAGSSKKSGRPRSASSSKAKGGEPRETPARYIPEPQAPEPSEVPAGEQGGSQETDRKPAADTKPAASLDEVPPLKMAPERSDALPELPPPLASPTPTPSTPAPLPLPIDGPTAAGGNRTATGRDQSFGDLPGSAPPDAVPPRPDERPADRKAPGDLAGAAAGPPPEPLEAAAPPSTSDSGSAPRGANEWSELRRQMRALGVSRYGIEGEPGGRTRFYCIIPLAGRRAVGQQFEAEGDDELEAARTALRRVVLWRAARDAESPQAAR